jgi:hypothetical protein
VPKVQIGTNLEWEKIKSGYKVKMPKEFAKKIQFKDPEKITEFEVKEETIPEPEHEDSLGSNKVILKCEDMLIEYCERLISILKKADERYLTKVQRE